MFKIILLSKLTVMNPAIEKRPKTAAAIAYSSPLQNTTNQTKTLKKNQKYESHVNQNKVMIFSRIRSKKGKKSYNLPTRIEEIRNRKSLR